MVTNSKGVDGGSSANEIHLPATEAAEVSTYPVQLTLSGEWGHESPTSRLKVTSSAGAIALLDGGGYLGSVTVQSAGPRGSGERGERVAAVVSRDEVAEIGE